MWPHHGHVLTASGRQLATDGRFVAVSVAAHLTGVPSRTLRRWAADGHVPAKDGQRGRLVDLDAVRRRAVLEGYSPAGPGQPAATMRPDMATGHLVAEDGQQPADSGHILAGRTRPAVASEDAPAAINLAELARVIDRLTRENVELAGRVGFLQSEVLHLKDKIALLEAPPAAATANPPETAESSRPDRSTGVEDEAVRPAQSEQSSARRPWRARLWPWGRQTA